MDCRVDLIVFALSPNCATLTSRAFAQPPGIERELRPRSLVVGQRPGLVVAAGFCGGLADGLAVGDSVARTGILQLKPGDAVRASK